MFAEAKLKERITGCAGKESDVIRCGKKGITGGKMKLNCWEVMKCGREPGGRNAEGLGICPAATCDKLDTVHGGKNAGRICWVVAGTMCGGVVLGSYARKYDDCRECTFYMRVREEEGSKFLLTIDLIS